MIRNLRVCLALTTALIASPALAQSGPDEVQDGSDQPAASAPKDVGVADIVVTAQRRDARLQDVPIAVSALTSKAMENAQIRNVIQLQSLSPSVVIDRLGSALTPFIRGVGSADGTIGQESAVAIYVDGVYRPAPFIANVDLNSIERVEVLKGPQGTLFGRNATGGAIQMITREPEFDPSMNVSLAYGSYRTVDTRAYLTGGLSDTIAADFAAVYHNQMDGFGRNIATGAEVYRDRNFAMRSKLMYRGDRAKVTLTGEYTELNNNLDAKQALPGMPLIDGTTYTGNWWDVNSSMDSFYRTRAWGLTGRLDYSFDGFDVVSITAFQKATMRTDWDQDGGPNRILDVSVDKADFRTLTQEIQLLSPQGSKVKWILGAFFMSDRTGTVPPRGLGLVGSGVGGGIGFNGVIKTKSYSVFGEATVPLTDSTNITGGLRWTRDERRISSFTAILDPTTFEVLTTIPNEDGAANYSKPSWRVILDHHFDPNIMAYASVSRGFKSGNFSVINPVAPPFRPEVLTAYEAGIKSDLFARRLRLNLAGFYYRYSDMQVLANFGTIVGTSNAGSAEIAGGEAEGQLALGRFNLNFGAGFLYSKFLSFDNGICYTPNPAGGDFQQDCSHAGDRLPKTPKLTLNLAPSYTVETGAGNLTASLTYYHTSSYFFEASSTLRQSSYDLLNGRLELTTPDGHLGFAVFAKNLLKEKYIQFAIAQMTGGVFSPAPPRTFGGEISFKF
jgi:iron complex outermembrane receptor protein